MKKEYLDKYRLIGLKINYYRKKKGYTQEQLAEKIGRHITFIGAVEAPNMNKSISLDTLFDIAKELDVEPYKFLMEDD